MSRGLCILLLLTASFGVAQDSNIRFRGPNGDGIAADDKRLPQKWDLETHVAWQADIKGLGWASPLVLGDRVFVASVWAEGDFERPSGGLYKGLGNRKAPDSLHHWMVYCLDLKTGKQLWEKELHSMKPPVPRHPKSTYAVETPTTDGTNIFVLFGDVGLHCLNVDGKALWSHEIEPKDTFLNYGAAASPVVHDGQVIMVYDNQRDSFIASFDTKTGKENWRTARDETSTWATPFVWKNNKRIEIVTAGRKKIRSYDLKGKLLWELEGRMSSLTIPSPFAADGLLFVTSGYVGDRHRPTYAIAPGATGDITLKKDETSNDFVKWYLPKAGPYNTTPIVCRGEYITVHDRGFLTAHNAATGEEIYSKRRFPKQASFTASPWAYNGNVYFLSEQGDTWMMTPGSGFEVERINQLGELCIATPSIAQGRLLVRTATKMLCVTKPS